MALVVKDRVRETSTTTGTGTLTLAGAVTGFQTFSSAIGNTNTTYYTITNGAEFEVGIGTVGAGTLARTTILDSSNGGSVVTLTAGTKDVFVTYPAGKAIYTDASNNTIALGTPASATLTNATGLPLTTGVTGTLPIANGGTGTTSTTFANLTTNVTGTLPVANGGTGTATAFTTGSVVFAGASGTYTQDNANFFWDDTNNRLGMGTSSPSVRLHIKAAASTFVNFAQENTNGGTDAKIVDWINNGNTYSLRLINDAYNASNSAYAVERSGYTISNHVWYTGSGTERMRIDSTGNVGIGTTSPAEKLNIGSGNLKFSSTSQRIIGDMSNGTLANRLSFQTSTVNGNTAVTAIPNGTSTTSSFRANNNVDPDNCGTFALTSSSTDARLTAGIQGTGTYLPITMYTNNAERMRIHSSGGVSIGNTTDSGLASLNVSGSISGGYIAHANGTTAMAFGANNVARVTPTATASYTTTVPAAGAICVLSILTSGATSYTITFSTGFKSTGTLATGTTTARYFNITFVSDGTNLIEMSRTTAIT